MADVYPTTSCSEIGRWCRQVSDTTNGPVGQAINLYGGLGLQSGWTPINLLLDAPAMDLAFRIEGDAVGRISAPATAVLMAADLVGLTLRARREA